MGNSRFVTVNWATASVTSLENGGGGGAPALEQETPFVMARLLTSDRFRFWRTSAAPASTVNVDFDFGANRTIDYVGVHGFRAATPAAATTVDVYASSGGYPGAGSWGAALGTFTLSSNPRDIGIAIASGSRRYLRFAIACTAQFQVGKFLAGSAVDLGAAHGPNARSSPARFRSEIVGPTGATLIEDLGDQGRTMTIPLPTAKNVRRQTIEALANQAGTFAYVDPFDALFEVFIPGGLVDVERLFYFDDDTISAVDVTLERVP